MSPLFTKTLEERVSAMHGSHAGFLLAAFNLGVLHIVDGADSAWRKFHLEEIYVSLRQWSIRITIYFYKAKMKNNCCKYQFTRAK